MTMIELPNCRPSSSIASYRISTQNSLYGCDFRNRFRFTICCSYVYRGLKSNTGFPRKIGSSRVLVDEVARVDFEPVFNEKEEKIETSLQLSLPHWGSSSGQDVNDQNRLDSSQSRILLKSNSDEIEASICYLEERDEVVLSERLMKLSRSNKVRSALALCKSMELSGLLPEPHACNSLLSCLLRNGRVEDALKIFEFMKSSEIVTSHTYSLLLKAVASAWGFDAALNIFKEAESDEKMKKYIDAIVYNTMIAIYGKLNDWLQVERIWRSMQENHIVGTVVTYRLLICTFVRSSQNELALDAYHEMIQNGLSPTDDAMEAIIGACSREGKWDMALNVMHSMLNREMKPSLVTCNALINTLGKSGKAEHAFKIYDLVKSLGYTPDAFTWNALLGALNRANRHGDALRLFGNIKNEYGSVLNLHTYNTCLVSCQRLGLWERALQFLWEMEDVGLPVSVTSYNLAIGACEVARKPKVALQVYQHMVQKKQSPDIFTPLSLIRVCIWGSLWKEVEEILDSAPNGSLYNAAIQGMCLRKENDLARKLYTKMRESGLKPDGKTRALMLQNLQRNRQV